MNFQQGLASVATNTGTAYKSFADETARLDDKLKNDEAAKLKLDALRRTEQDAADAAARTKDYEAQFGDKLKAQAGTTAAQSSQAASDKFVGGLMAGKPSGAPQGSLEQAALSAPASEGVPSPSASRDTVMQGAGLSGAAGNPTSSHPVTSVARTKPAGFLADTDTKPAAAAEKTPSEISHELANEYKAKGDAKGFDYFTAKFKADVQVEHRVVASDALAKLSRGDTSGFVLLFNKHLKNGVDIQGEVGTKKAVDGSAIHVFKLSDGTTEEMPDAALRSSIVEFGSPGTALSEHAASLKDEFLTNGKIRLANATGESDAHRATAASSYSTAYKNRQDAEKERMQNIARHDAALDPNVPENTPKIEAAKRVLQQFATAGVGESFGAHVIDGEDGPSIAVTGNRSGNTTFTYPSKKAAAPQPEHSQADLEHTAKLHNITVAQVKEKLGIK
jgi:hypothetical protein